MLPKPKVIVIAGPTASGKTALSVSLALRLGGEIINADSMQVYRGMDVGTAKPSEDERKGVAHHLLDVVDPDGEFSAARYRSMAIPLAADIRARGKVCLVVGGTGLYLRSFLNGLFDCPPSNEALRDSLRKEAAIHGALRLHQSLEEMDPESARRIHPNDLFRIIRAIEIYRLTGAPASRLRSSHGFRDSQVEALELFLEVDRDELYRRIDRRCETMAAGGLVEETRALLEKGYGPHLKSMQALGYRHMIRHLSGECSLEEAIRTLQRDTRRYAKRQMTWFRGEPDARWVRTEHEDEILDLVTRFMSDDA
jgi:tRNA dimethylallyltransferase